MTDQLAKEDIRRELHRMVDSHREQMQAKLEGLIAEMKGDPGFQSDNGRRKAERISGDITSKLGEADAMYDQFHRFIDAA